MRVIERQRVIAPRDPRLKRHVNHDSESRRYEHVPVHSGPLLPVQHLRRSAVLDQGQLGSCVPNAGIGCLGTDPFYATVTTAEKYHSLDETDALALYSVVTADDPYPGQYPPDDTGSDGKTCGKALTEAGMISGYEWTFTLDAALATLQTQPVITGVDWYDGMFGPTTEGLVRISGSVAGGHEFVVDGYDPVRAWVWCTNSWGTGWGVKGRFALEVSTWSTLLNASGDVTVFVPNTAPAPVPAPVPHDPLDIAMVGAIPAGWTTAAHIGNNAKAAHAVRAWEKAKGLS